MPAQIWWAKGPQDSFTVNPKTGDVIGQSDGIAEMIFRVKFKQQSQSGNNEQHNNEDARPSAWLGFHDGHFDTEQFARLSFIGAHAGDFAAYGGKLTLGDEIPPLVSAQFRLSQGELSDFHQVFQSGHLRGKPRLWPVVADCSSAVGEPTVGIIGFVAGCVVDTGSDADGSLLVTIQPCLMQTPTALTGAVAQRNPWIGKLLLVR